MKTKSQSTATTAAQTLGRLGGPIKSPAKTAACRLNARLPRRRRISKTRALALIAAGPDWYKSAYDGETVSRREALEQFSGNFLTYYKKGDVVSWVEPPYSMDIKIVAIRADGPVYSYPEESIGSFDVIRGIATFEMRRVKLPPATQ